MVVLLHGIGASVYIWRFLLPLLTKKFSVIAFDLPGFGKSEKHLNRDYGLDAQSDRIIHALLKLNVASAHLIGSSMGGTIALWMARQNPKMFPGLVVLAPATHPDLVPVKLSWLRHLAGPAAIGLTPFVMRRILKRIMSRHELVTDECVHHYLEPYRETETLHTFLLSTHLLRDKRLPYELRQISSPVLTLWGQRDSIVARKYMDELCQIIPNIAIQVHESAGHHSMEDEPDWVIAQVERFFPSESRPK